jgi:two-component system response regulator FixJ
VVDVVGTAGGMTDIFIVDPDELTLAALRARLSDSHDGTIRTYRSAEAFLGALDPDDRGILLVEFHLPRMQGLDLVRALDARRGPFVSIMLGAAPEVALVVAAMRTGAHDVLEKPYLPHKLAHVVESARAVLETLTRSRAIERSAVERIGRLSRRERAVFDRLVAGQSTKEIAQDFALSPRTVEVHRANIMAKLDVAGLPDALRIAYDAGAIGQASASEEPAAGDRAVALGSGG